MFSIVPFQEFFTNKGILLCKGRSSLYLLTRGLLLVLLELTLIRFCWTFNVEYGKFLLAGVIWMLGWCMVLMAALIWLRPYMVGGIGLFIIFGQQLFHTFPYVLGLQGTAGRWWEFIYPYAELAPPFGMAVLYVLVPWIGVMAAGYGFGPIVQMSPAKRQKTCLWIPYAEKAKGWFAQVLITFGRVPLFYYLLHIPLIHLSALLVTFIREGAVFPAWYASAPFTSVPEGHRWGLGLLYLPNKNG